MDVILRFHAFRFSIKNETDVAITIKLDMGIIPSPDARYNELIAIPDDIYKIIKEAEHHW